MDTVELCRAVGADNHVYVVRPLVWSLEKIHGFWSRCSQYSIFSDAVGKTYEGFQTMVLSGGAIWFEMIDWDTGEAVGLMYVSDLSKAAPKELGSALWHGIVWDSQAFVRHTVTRTAIQALFGVFGLHKLHAEVPVPRGGAYRTARKLGFKVEGRRFQSKKYNGVWVDVWLLGLTAGEANAEGFIDAEFSLANGRSRWTHCDDCKRLVAEVEVNG